MPVQSLRLDHFRCHAGYVAKFGEGPTLIIGPNGSGKTSILEGIHYLSHLHSFRTRNAAELVQRGEAGFSLKMRTNQEELSVQWTPQARELAVDGCKPASPLDFWGRFSCVAVTTSDAELVSGPDAVRRQFLNGLLAQQSKARLRDLLRYRTLHRQRARLLREERLFDRAHYSVLTRQLVDLGRPLQETRREAAEKLGLRINTIVSQIVRTGEVIRLKYQPASWDRTEAEERALRRPLIGLQRDRMEFMLGNMDARRFASAGQKRTLALALRIAELEMLADTTRQRPVALVDDVLSELDDERRAGVMHLFAATAQVIVATAVGWNVGERYFENRIHFV